ncbi:hypothetical protein DPM19_00920 [Actinomadura craniellae]|uniref:Uncharacterized protein n=1 Tax=Actinomadura craniellae TaxID=2231787 RepID=A0A365HCA3_9ACTN|nr:hypothetical protein [Actinomadura craniellae]RAY16764.1 hypothetical protein DPM19_00920 [Actinomadura craniellae]
MNLIYTAFLSGLAGMLAVTLIHRILGRRWALTAELAQQRQRVRALQNATDSVLAHARLVTAQARMLDIDTIEPVPATHESYADLAAEVGRTHPKAAGLFFELLDLDHALRLSIILREGRFLKARKAQPLLFKLPSARRIHRRISFTAIDPAVQELLGSHLRDIEEKCAALERALAEAARELGEAYKSLPARFSLPL